MRTTFIILTLLCLCATLNFAAVHTVSNHPAGGAQYTTLQDAYNAATNGDTILLEPTNIAYFMIGCPQIWSKSLTVIGIGFNSDHQGNEKDISSGNTDCISEFRMGTGGSGSSFYGITFTKEVRTSANISNLHFESCNFAVGLNFDCRQITNFIIRNCIFDQQGGWNLLLGCGNVAQNGIISNCVFDGFIGGQGNTLADVVIENSLFLSSSAGIDNLHGCQIRNSIFMNSYIGGEATNCEFTNNICAVAGTFPPDPGNGNTGSGNLENTDPMLTTYTPGENYSTNHDYDLQGGSPGLNAGTDGTDIGLHGGSAQFSESGEVLITPIVRSVNILNTSVAPNGTLNVDVHATTPSNN